MRRKTRTVLRNGVWLIEKMTRKGPVVIGSNPFLEKNVDSTIQSQMSSVASLTDDIKKPTQKAKKGNLGRPRMHKHNDQKLVTFRIDAKPYKAVKKFCRTCNQSLSDWIRGLIAKELQSKK